MKSKREQLAELLKARINSPKDCVPSFAQQRMWYVDQLDPGSLAYNIPFAFRLKGILHVATLQQAFSEMIRRHEILRTVFPGKDGQLVQRINPPFEIELPIVDLQGCNEDQQEIEVKRLSNEEAGLPFDLEHGPLLRITLLRLKQQDHDLLFTMHHIISDGWSMEIIVRESIEIYEAFKNGRRSPFAPLAVQYADFSVWQRQWLQGERLEKQLGYWRQQLAGMVVLELPLDQQRPIIPSHRGALENFVLSADLGKRLKRLSQQQGVTLFITMMAAFQWLLSRYSGEEDIAIGTFIANRNDLDTEKLIGFFVNQLVLRTNVGGNLTFCELLDRARQTVLEAYAHQDLPFERLVEELTPERELDHSPLFRIQIVLQNAPAAVLGLPGLEISQLALEKRMSKMDLSLFLHERGDIISGSMEYDIDIFKTSTIGRLLSHYEVLLEEITINPLLPLLSISLGAKTQFEELAAAFSEDIQALEI